MIFEDDELKELLKKRKNKHSHKKITLILLTLSLLITISFISIKIEKKERNQKVAITPTTSISKPVYKNFKLKNTLNRVNKRLQEYKQNNVLKLYQPDIKLLSLHRTYAIVRITSVSYLVYNNSKVDNYYISRIGKSSISVVYKGTTYRIGLYKR